MDNGRRLALPSDGPAAAAESDEARQRLGDQRHEAALPEVLEYLRMRSGHDFSCYKRASVVRRLGRRMQVNDCTDATAYLDYLRRHSGEADALLQDLLISVTNFFRDVDAFAALEASLPRIFQGLGPEDQLRVWVPGCATGEEPYSLAILLSEHAGLLEAPPQIQIFATDIDGAAIAVARFGLYPDTITTDVSDERLKRFFTKEAGGYRVRRSLRELVLFAHHNLLNDPPFSRLDLISCRNLLIYLERAAQRRTLEIFHFALRTDGLLFLGCSETADESVAMFAPVDKEQRIYARGNAPRNPMEMPVENQATGDGWRHIQEASLRAFASATAPLTRAVGSRRHHGNRAPGATAGSMATLHFRLMERLIPASLVVDSDYNIVHLSESASNFMRFSSGEPTMNVLGVIHPTLRTDLRATLFQTATTGKQSESPPIAWESGGRTRWIRIEVHPSGKVADNLYLVVFHHEPAGEERHKPAAGKQGTPDEVKQLEDELGQFPSQWSHSAEEHESSNEELQASNEELQAMNDEMRWATEGLETGREELQSINDEVTTVNMELKSKVEELSRANVDLQNLMASTTIATLFLDRELAVQRYTPSALKLFNLIPSDIGRPLSDITHRLDFPAMIDDARQVLKNLSPVEREVQADGVEWYLVRMLPYRTQDDDIGGVVMTCIDITKGKQDDETRRWLSEMVESSNDAILSFSMDGDIISWNHGAERMFGYSAAEMIGRSQATLAGPDYQDEKKRLLETLQRGEAVPSFETVRVRKDGTQIDVGLSASVMRDGGGKIVGATAIAQDITERKRAVEQLQKARDELEHRVEERTAELRKRADQLRRMATQLTRGEQVERLRMSRLLHDQVQQLLVSAKMRVEGLVRGEGAVDRDGLRVVAGLLQDTLASARTLAVDLSPPVLTEGLAMALEWLGAVWMKDRHGLTVHLDLDHDIDAASEEIRALVYLAVREILFNVVKHADVEEACVSLSAAGGGKLRVDVRDHGKGFELSLLESRDPRNLGLGLTGLEERFEMIGGEFKVCSKNGEGVEVGIEVPARPLGKQTGRES